MKHEIFWKTVALNDVSTGALNQAVKRRNVHDISVFGQQLAAAYAFSGLILRS
jgi:hypothetical protein